MTERKVLVVVDANEWPAVDVVAKLTTLDEAREMVCRELNGFQVGLEGIRAAIRAAIPDGTGSFRVTVSNGPAFAEWGLSAAWGDGEVVPEDVTGIEQEAVRVEVDGQQVLDVDIASFG